MENKKQQKIFIISVILITGLYGQSQVSIGTTSPEASARFQIDANAATNAKGFLPPRVALMAVNDVSPFISITPATGLLVYNTASTSGSFGVTPGFYYFDGAKWQRIINQQPDATVTFDGTDPNSGTNFSGTTLSRDFIYVSNNNNSQWTYNGASYVTYTPPASTAWYLSGGTNDAGSNKTGAVYRSGSVGIGTATSPNASAQLDVNSTTKGFLPPRMTSAQRTSIASPAAGLMVYQTDGTVGFYYYNGSAWMYVINSANSTLPVANGGTGVTTSTGSGSNVLSTSPTLTTPVIGTTVNSAVAGALLYGSGVMYYSNGSTWKPLATVEVDNSYKLVSTGVASVINTQQSISTGSSYTTLTGSQISVIVPSGFTDSRIILQWNVWGDVYGSNSNHASGSIRYQINQTTPTNVNYESVMMTGWFAFYGTAGVTSVTRYSSPVTYILTNPSAGTYTFSLQMRRESETGTINSFSNWGVAGTGQVFAR